MQKQTMIISAAVETEVYNELKEISINTGRAISWIVRTSVTEWLEKQNEQERLMKEKGIL